LASTQDVLNIEPPAEGGIHQNAIERAAQVFNRTREEVTYKEAGRWILVEQVRGQVLGHFDGNGFKWAAQVGQRIEQAASARRGLQDAPGCVGDECGHTRGQRWGRGEELIHHGNVCGRGVIR
jgi:hypothetical protein